MTQSELAAKIAGRLLEADLITAANREALSDGLTSRNFGVSDWTRFLNPAPSTDADNADPSAT